MVIMGTIIHIQKKQKMNSINIRKFGLAVGSAGVLLYLGCIILMLTVGREGTIQFFNSLLHGLEVSPIIRMSIPWWETLLGLVETFIIAWLFGASIASIYNFSLIKGNSK